MLLWGSIIILGSMAYMIMNDTDTNVKDVTTNEEVEEVSLYSKTYLYWCNLPLEYQKKYMDYNVYLKEHEYKLTDNIYFNARLVAGISEKLGKEFTNDLCKY